MAPRGETQWVRNIRVAGGGELRVGRRVEAFTIAGDPDALLRLRVGDLDHLKHVIDHIRRTGKATGTKTLFF